MRLLVVEDDHDLNRQMVKALEDAGYAVDRAFDGEEGHFLGETEPYDAVVLDVGLPKIDGITVLERWRRAGRAMPVLILTARDRWSDKVQGFDSGADDYVAKPFHMEEVLARLRALIRRTTGHATNELVCGPVRLDAQLGPRRRRRQSGQADVARIPPARLSDASFGPRRLAHGARRASLRPGFRPRFEHHRGVRRAPAQEARRRRHPDRARHGLHPRAARHACADDDALARLPPLRRGGRLGRRRAARRRRPPRLLLPARDRERLRRAPARLSEDARRRPRQPRRRRAHGARARSASRASSCRSRAGTGRSTGSTRPDDPTPRNRCSRPICRASRASASRCSPAASARRISPGPDGRRLRAVERQIDLGEDGRYRVMVAGPADEIDAEIAPVRRGAAVHLRLPRRRPGRRDRAAGGLSACGR